MQTSTAFIRRPQEVTAVAILHTDGSTDDQRLSDALAANGVAVVCVSTGVNFEVGLALANEEFGAHLPRMVAASGHMVPAAQRAAEAAGLTASVLLNAPIGRSVLRQQPTMVFVDRSLLGTRLWSRVASRVGNASYHVVDTNLESPLKSWLTNPDAIVRDTLVSTRTVGALAVAAALTVAPMLAPLMLASPSHDPYDNGVAVSSSQINGDATVAKTEKVVSESDGAAVPASAMSGDGTKLVAPAATGSVQLIDGNHMKWFVNTNITFNTTSSASAALSEGSMTAPSATVTTSAGGVATTALNDAFDGYGSLFVDLGAPNVNGAVSTHTYRPAVAPTADVDCASRQYNFAVQSMQGLDVSRSIYVPTDGDYARHLNTLTNPTAAAITVSVATMNNLGSDSNTRITGSSSGDQVADLTDSWVGTFQNYSGISSSDPREAHVIQGNATPSLAPANVTFVDGDDNPTWGWTVTVQPGETISLMSYVVAETTKARAAASATSLAAMTPLGDGTVPGLRCMTSAQLNSVANFAITPPDVSVASVTVNEAAGVATLTFTRSGSLGTTDATFSLTDGTANLTSDYTSPASLTVSFLPGETTKTVDVAIVDDTVFEADETITATITAVTGYGQVASGAGASATITITNDDAAPVVVPAPEPEPTTTTTAALFLPPGFGSAGDLPATGNNSGSIAWFGAAFAAAGAALVRVARRNPATKA
jgi:LPXTG-motif cell wall-anchored protein